MGYRRALELRSAKQIILLGLGGGETIVWRNGVGSTDIERIAFSGEDEFRTICSQCINPAAELPSVQAGSIRGTDLTESECNRVVGRSN